MQRLRITFVNYMLAGFICFLSAQQTEMSDRIRFISASRYLLPEGKGRFIEDNSGRMVISILGNKGLIGVIKDSIVEPVVKGYIADVTRGPDATIWYMGRRKISSVDPCGKNQDKNYFFCFFKENMPNKITYSGNPLFYRDRFGIIWFSNAPFRVTPNMKSLPNPGSGQNTDIFPLPLTTDPFGNMWGLVATGEKNMKAICILKSGDKQWAVYDKTNGFPVDQWSSVISDIEGIIWVSGKAGLCFFDPRKSGGGWHIFVIPGKEPSVPVSQMTLSQSGRVLILLQSGEIYEVNVDSKYVPVVKPIETESLPKFPVNALYTDRGGRIWVVVKNMLYRQDKKPVAWQTLTSMPYGNHDVFGVEMNSKIYIPGGGASHGLPVASRNFDCLMIYDIKNDRWELSSPMSINRRYCSVGLLEGKIWVIGGNNIAGERKGRDWNDTPVNTVEIYDPVSGKWTPGPELDVPRAETITLTMAGRLYVFGANGKEKYNTLSIAPDEKSWRTEPPSPYPILQTTGCVYNSQAYIMIGGVGLIMYDPATQTWHQDFPPVPGSKAPWSSALVTSDNKILVISGREIDDGTKVFVYSPAERSWSYGTPIPYPTLWAGAIDMKGCIYLFGGATLSNNRKDYVFWDLIRVLKNY